LNLLRAYSCILQTPKSTILSNVYLWLLTSKSNLHRSKWRTTCYGQQVKLSPKSDG